MRAEIVCEGCGARDVRVVESWAAFEAVEEVEILVVACAACGHRATTERRVA